MNYSGKEPQKQENQVEQKIKWELPGDIERAFAEML